MSRTRPSFTCTIAFLSFALLSCCAPASRAQVVAQSGADSLTEQDLSTVLFIDNCVLDTPLSTVEQQQARQNIIRQFQNDPMGFTGSKALNDKVAEILRHGSLADRTELAMELWAAWNQKSETDTSTKWWVGLVKPHNPPIAQSGGLVVTRLQLNGLFADNDWVAKAAGLPPTTVESRAAFVRELPQKFAAMPLEEKLKLSHADVRWFDLHNPILNHSDLRQIAVNEVHEHVHGASEVYAEARALEDVGVRFNNEMAQFTHNMAAIGGLDYQTKSNINNLNFADRKFWGQR
jgi:hypothetical protein